MLRGENLSDLVNRVKDLLDKAEVNAEHLVRTSAMSALNAAQMAAWEANGDSLQELQWCATLDPRTCLVCGTMDGDVWPVGEAHATAPLHWNCRCCVVPVPQLWSKLGLEPPAGVRAAWGGQVSGDTTWESWLKGLPEDQQKEILGPARQHLWQSWKITISDLRWISALSRVRPSV